jgi:hypothetical protein
MCRPYNSGPRIRRQKGHGMPCPYEHTVDGKGKRAGLKPAPTALPEGLGRRMRRPYKHKRDACATAGINRGRGRQDGGRRVGRGFRRG